MILTSMEPNIFRMLFSIKNKNKYDAVSLLFLWWAKKPVLSMKCRHGWLLLKTPLEGLQHHIFFIFDGKQRPKNIWYRGF